MPGSKLPASLYSWAFLSACARFRALALSFDEWMDWICYVANCCCCTDVRVPQPSPQFCVGAGLASTLVS